MGIGHVMRCLTIANAAKTRGASTRFISRHLLASLRTLIADAGHELVELPHSSASEAPAELRHSYLLGTTQAADSMDSLRALSDQHWDWVVVDHYALDARWETPIRSAASRNMVIDDLADRAHDADILLDQNISAKNLRARYDGKVSARCTLLLGPEYALLRDEFLQLRESVKGRSGKVERILVFFGGTDSRDYTSRALEGIVSANLEHLSVDVVIGAEHPNRGGIERACAERGFACHVNTARMAELTAGADLAIGAGGSASWERCCLGLPAICIPAAENQIAVARGLEERGAIVVVEPTSSLAASVSKALVKLAGSPVDLAAMSVKARALVDGHGAQRVCDLLFQAA
jgi:UDP-2,4-diacetamido-2,4,6-trideoxy-beta-L-altropyranose hydrolase